jgi:hypothetical protein
VQAGSITPAATGELIYAGLDANNNMTGLAIDSGLTLQGENPSGANQAGADAWLIDSNTSPINPQWSLTSGSNTLGAVIAAFKPAVVNLLPYGGVYD